MTRRSQLGLIIGACFITGLVIVGYLIARQSGHRLSLTFGNTSIDATLLGFFAVKIILFIAAISFIVQGFRVHWGWGLANIFLFPLAGIALFIRHRREGKVPMMIWAFGMALLIILLICVSLGM
jgi:hypothetical protein